MKTILSGVKEWTENLTDDAIDKANNAIDKANNALDKALFVVNITRNRDGTFSADKTFDEIVQVYNDGKYNIVAHIMGVYIMPPLGIISAHAVMFATNNALSMLLLACSSALLALSTASSVRFSVHSFTPERIVFM